MNAPIRIIELAGMVDRLAVLKAMIEPLQKEEAAIKDALKATGRERIDGTKHTAVISLSERTTLDMKRIEEERPRMHKLLFKRFGKTGLIETLRLTGRKTH